MSASASSANLTPATRPALLRAALKLDAVVTGANGLAYLAAAAPLGDLLGLTPSLLRAGGALLVAFAVGVWATAARPSLRRSAVLAVVAVNVLWSAGSIVAAAAAWGSPTVEGTVWIILQAVVVAVFAELQVVGLKRHRRAG